MTNSPNIVNPTNAKDTGTQESQVDLNTDTTDKESHQVNPSASTSPKDTDTQESGASTNMEKPSPKTSTEKPPPQKRFKAHQAVEKIMNMTGSTCSHIDSDSEFDDSFDCTKL